MFYHFRIDLMFAFPAEIINNNSFEDKDKTIKVNPILSICT